MKLIDEIDKEKLSQIMELRKFDSKEEAVNEALNEYLKDLMRQEALKLKSSNC